MTVFIVAEYNPFHNGHLYQITKIREIYGPETHIVAVMSGNYTQRGECSILGQYDRARACVLCGVDLVLELPFPFSSSSAELFASAAVRIAHESGICDVLAFGSDGADTDTLTGIAKKMESDDFRAALREKFKERDVGYSAAYDLAYKDVFGDDVFRRNAAQNNLLALEYIRALGRLGSTIRPLAIPRVGVDHDAKEGNGKYASASRIRSLIEFGDFEKVKDYLPEKSYEVLMDGVAGKECPASTNRLSPLFLSHLRYNPPSDVPCIHGASGGLYSRLYKNANKAADLLSFIHLCETKKYTNARIRRTVLYSYFGVTSSDVKDPISFTRVLALNQNGAALLKAAKKSSSIPILTKPSDRSLLCDLGIRQISLCDRANSVYQFAKPQSLPGDTELKKKPFVM